MPKGKCEMKSAKASHKKCALKTKETVTAKKQTNKEVEMLDGVDSLSFLKDTKERKKLDDIDERIMLLKSELKSLMGESKPDKDCDIEDKNLCNVQKIDKTAKEAECSMISEHSGDFKVNKVNKMKEFNPASSSTPKFTEWLNNIMDTVNLHPHSNTIEILDSNNSSLTSEIQVQDSTSNRFPQTKVEELLYKTFSMQNGLLHFFDTSSKNISSKRKAKNQENCKSEKTCKKPDLERPAQEKSKCHRVSNTRKKRLVSLHFSDSDVEVINLDNEGPKSEPTYVDLDVSNYDWTEPFDLNDQSESQSVQLINEPETDVGMSNERLKTSSSEQEEGKKSSESVTQQEKKAWECPVCFEQSKGQEIVATQCGHVFCKTCLEAHTSKVKNNCPTCRANLANKPVITLFNF